MDLLLNKFLLFGQKLEMVNLPLLKVFIATPVQSSYLLPLVVKLNVITRVRLLSNYKLSKSDNIVKNLTK